MDTAFPLSGADARAQTSQTTQTVQATTISSDFQTFLELLTTQARNQDPLNPIDATDYATQLATFSSVEQQVKTNDLLSSIGSALGTSALQDLQNWIGAEVLAPVAADFDGAPIEVHPDVAPGADAAVLVVRDGAGTVVSRQTLGTTGAPVAWSGADQTGRPLPEGAYGFSVESYSGEELLETRPARVYATVTEARSAADGTITLRTAVGEEIGAEAVGGIRVAE